MRSKVNKISKEFGQLNLNQKFKYERKLGEINIGTWALLRLKVNKSSLEIFVNEVSTGIQDIMNYTESNQFYLMDIGGSPNKQKSIHGFIWSLSVDTNFIEDNYMPVTTLTCFAAYLYNEEGEYKCFPDDLDIKKNSLGAECNQDCKSCTSQGCLNCKCQVSSCEMKLGKSLCICPSKASANETSCECPSGSFFTGYSCEACTLQNCAECIDLNTCKACLDTFLIIDGKCQCGEGRYEADKTCKNCTQNCSLCADSQECIKCSPGFYLDSQAKCRSCKANCAECDESNCLTCADTFFRLNETHCACKTGYNDYGVCVRKRFIAEISVSIENVVVIEFNSTLDSLLRYEDFLIKSSLKNLEIKFIAKNSAIYEFSVTSNENIEQGSEFNISIKNKKLKSSDNSLYYQTDLSVNLYKLESNNKLSKVLKSNTKSAVGAALGVAAFSGLFGSASFFWILFNTLQLITFLPLNSTPYPKDLVEFFTYLNLFNLFPSIYKLIGLKVDDSLPYFEARRFGINTSLFLVNIELIVVQFLINLIILVLLLLGSLIFKGKIRDKCLNKMQSYRYGYFLKLLTGGYIDFLIYALIQLKDVSIMQISKSIFGVFSTFLAFAAIVRDF